MDRTMTLILWHGGKVTITDDDDVKYEGGQMCVWEDIPCDTFNLFDVHNLGKTHGYHSFEKVWWRNRQVDEPGLYQLRQILSDHDTVSMCTVSSSTNGEIEVYFEHPICEVPLNVLLSVLQKENEQVPVEDANEQVPVQEENEVGTVEEANEQVPVQDNIEVVPVQEEVPVNEDHEYDTNVESDDSVEVVEIIQKDKGKGKVSERKKGKVAERKKGKLADKGRGKVADKGKRKISDAGGSRRKRKQEKVVDGSETESDDLGFDGLWNDGSDSDSDDNLYVPPV